MQGLKTYSVPASDFCTEYELDERTGLPNHTLQGADGCGCEQHHRVVLCEKCHEGAAVEAVQIKLWRAESAIAEHKKMHDKALAERNQAKDSLALAQQALAGERALVAYLMAALRAASAAQ